MDKASRMYRFYEVDLSGTVSLDYVPFIHVVSDGPAE